MLKRKMKPDEGTLRHKLFNVVDVRCSKALRHRPEPPTTYAETVKAIKKWYQIEETHQKKDAKKVPPAGGPAPPGAGGGAGAGGLPVAKKCTWCQKLGHLEA